MCNAHNLVAYCCELFNYDSLPLSLCVHLHGFEKGKKSVFATRILMYSIAAKMILDGEY